MTNMGLETGTYIDDLVSSNPIGGTDPFSEGDDHLRLIKAVLKTTLPNATKPFYFPTVVAAKTGVYTVVAADLNKVIPVDVSGGAFTISLTAAATLGDGFSCIIIKSDSSANAVTIDASGAELINAATTFTLDGQYHAVRLHCTGTAWYLEEFNIPATTAQTRYGLVPGTDVQAQNARLADVAGLGVTNGAFIVGDGSNFVLESGATARTSLGLGGLATLSSVDTAEITNLAVTEGKIANNAVTLAKMAHGTDGNLITFNSSGAPAYVSTGSADQLLTSNGAGAAPTFQTFAVGTETAALSLGAIGTYAFLNESTAGSGFTAGSTYSGSILRYSGVLGDKVSNGNPASVPENGGTPSGTWRAMGTVSASGDDTAFTLFLRIS